MEQLFAVLLAVWSLFTTVTTAPEQADVGLSTPTVEAEVVSVIDGDTIDVLIDGEEARVRYIGIDTPEPHHTATPECYSTEATTYNTELVAGQVVTLVPDAEDTDRYGRLLRYVYVDDVFVNAVLLEGGYATTLSIPPNTAHQADFTALAAAAEAADRGLWGACQNEG